MLRWFVNYIRQCFCRHEWERDEREIRVEWQCGKLHSSNIRVSERCGRCGWHRAYRKF